MSKAKFTKGPWSLKETPSGMEIQAGGGWLFLLDDGRKPTDAGSDFLETQDANLNVMLAAPELYEALRALCAWHDHPSLTGNKHGAPVADWAPSFDETVTMVHAALAKARGEQS